MLSPESVQLVGLVDEFQAEVAGELPRVMEAGLVENCVGAQVEAEGTVWFRSPLVQ